jgi:hypothetical protein
VNGTDLATAVFTDRTRDLEITDSVLVPTQGTVLVG